MLEKEFQYYLDHQAELVKKYNDKYIVIVGEEVVGVYTDHTEAFNDSINKYEKGTFLIQYCGPGEQAYSQTFHSRVVV